MSDKSPYNRKGRWTVAGVRFDKKPPARPGIGVQSGTPSKKKSTHPITKKVKAVTKKASEKFKKDIYHAGIKKSGKDTKAAYKKAGLDKLHKMYR